MWMAAGFAMLEAGLVRSKNVSMQCLKNIALYSIAGLMFWVIGYSLMYTNVNGGYFGTPLPYSWPDAGTANEGDYSVASDWFFQMVFCATTASIVSGTLAERIKLWPFLIFTAILTGVLYPITGSWQWGGGWLSEAGFSDFAGSTLVHSVGGWAALAGAIILGARKGKYGADGKVTRCRVRTWRSPRSVPSSCGSAGSASTAHRSWQWARTATCPTSAGSLPTPTLQLPAAWLQR
jgi:Amt family ammonium transporter